MRFKVMIRAPGDLGARLAEAASAYASLQVELLPVSADPPASDMLAGVDAVVLHEPAASEHIAAHCRFIRSHTDRPLIVLTSDEAPEVCVAALDAGADDCLPVSLGERETWVRVRGQLRRVYEYTRRDESPEQLRVGELVIDVSRHEISYGAAKVELTPKEFELLAYLARNAGRAVPRCELLATIWGLKPGMDSRTLDVHIGRLRSKLEGEPGHPGLILTVPGIGYKLME